MQFTPGHNSSYTSVIHELGSGRLLLGGGALGNYMISRRTPPAHLTRVVHELHMSYAHSVGLGQWINIFQLMNVQLKLD